MGGSEAFREFLRRRSQKVGIDAAEAGFFEHRPTRGVAREEVLRAPLREILPERFGIATGEVHASDGSVSGQLDLIVYDRLNTPRLYEGFTSVVLPIETVLAVISVKSKLSLGDVDATRNMAESLRQMPLAAVSEQGLLLDVASDIDFHTRPAVYLYGFGGPNHRTIRDHIYASLRPETPIQSLLNAVVVHGHGLVLPTGPGEQPVGFLQEANNVGSEEASDGTFGVFLSFLYAALTTAPRVAPRLGAYIDAGLLVSQQ